MADYKGTCKEAVDAIIHAIKTRPETLKIGEHTLDDTVTGISYWTSNGWVFGGIYAPMEMGFSLFQKLRFRYWYKKLAWYQVAFLTNNSMKKLPSSEATP